MNGKPDPLNTGLINDRNGNGGISSHDPSPVAIPQIIFNVWVLAVKDADVTESLGITTHKR